MPIAGKLYSSGELVPHEWERLEQIGAAGFYGRGYTAHPPADATVIHTIGLTRANIDIEYPLGDGKVLVHSGNALQLEETSTSGRLLVSSADPVDHHGSVGLLELRDDGLVTEEFIEPSLQAERSAAENAHAPRKLKREMRDRLRSRATEDIYDAKITAPA